MQIIQRNTLVTITLKMESKDGDFLDESEKLMYLQGGYGQIFQKLENHLESKKVGDTFDITLEAVDAFGEYDDSLLIREPLQHLPAEIEIGMDLDGEEEGIVWFVEKIEEEYATLNANHELAGIALVLSGEILDVEQLSEEGAQKILNMEHEH
ncbi:MAG: peptidylprolyl isomerase [Campylobacterota bacterium]|nr:peptidylprolyl isomerase [Campylobacterota bacterium]